MDKHIFKIIPVDVEFIHEDQLSALIIEGTLREDFGPWKKGSTHTLSFNFETGVIEEHDDEGQLIISHNFTLTLTV